MVELVDYARFMSDGFVHYAIFDTVEEANAYATLNPGKYGQGIVSRRHWAGYALDAIGNDPRYVDMRLKAEAVAFTDEAATRVLALIAELESCGRLPAARARAWRDLISEHSEK